MLPALAFALWACTADTRAGHLDAAGAAVHGGRPGNQALDDVPVILARVNGVPVTQGDLQRLLADAEARRQLIRELGDETPDRHAIQRLAVSRLIQRRLFLEEGVRRNLTVTEQDVDDAVTALRSRFADLGAFGAWIQKRGLDERTLFDAVRDDLLAARAVAALVADVAIGTQEIQDYHDAHPEARIAGEEVRLRIIAVDSPAAARGILAALRTGEDFAQLARTHSRGARAAAGGDTGWVDLVTLPRSLRGVVAQLRPGEASHPLKKADDEFLIVALAGRRPLAAKTLDAARPWIEQHLLAARRQESVRAWLEAQELSAQVEVYPDAYVTTAHDTAPSSGHAAMPHPHKPEVLQ